MYYDTMFCIFLITLIDSQKSFIVSSDYDMISLLKKEIIPLEKNKISVGKFDGVGEFTPLNIEKFKSIFKPKMEAYNELEVLSYLVNDL